MSPDTLTIAEKAINDFLSSVDINQPISPLKDVDPNESTVLLEYEFPKINFGFMSPIIKEMSVSVRVQLPKEGDFERMINFSLRYGYKHTGGGGNGYSNDYVVMIDSYGDSVVVERNQLWRMRNVIGDMKDFEEEKRKSNEGQEQIM